MSLSCARDGFCTGPDRRAAPREARGATAAAAAAAHYSTGPALAVFLVASWLLSANRKSAEGQTTPKPLLSALTVSLVPVLGIPYPVPGILPRLDHHRSDQDPPEIVPRVGSGTSGAALVALLGHTTPGGTLPQISLDGGTIISPRGNTTSRPWLLSASVPSPPIYETSYQITNNGTHRVPSLLPPPNSRGHRPPSTFGLVLQQHPSGPRFLLLYLVSGQTLTQLRCALFFEPPLQSRPACPSPDPQALSGHCSAVLVLYLSNLHPPLPSYRRHDRSRLHSCTTNDMLSLPL